MTGRAARTAAALALAWLVPASAVAQAAAPRLAFTIGDSAFSGPAAFTSGVVSLEVTNRGRVLHQLQLLRLAAAHEAAEARTYILTHNDLPNWVSAAIGIGPIEPGQRVTVTGPLDPGNYLLIDLLSAADGRPNFRAGLIGQLRGTGPPARALPAVPAVAGLMVTDRFFRFGTLIRSGNTWTLTEGRARSTQLRRGRQTIRIEATSSGGHSVVLMRGGPEVMRQYAAWIDGRRPAPPPGVVGGVAAIPASTLARYFIEVELAAGSYVFFCPASHARYGARGFESGEFAQFVVR